MKKLYVGSGIIAAIVIAGCGVSSKDNSTPEDSQRLNDNANANSAVGSSPTASSVVKVITAGDWELGKKENIGAGVITAGTYIITTPSDGINCYWETVRDFNQDINSIIANGNIDPGKTARVVVKKNYAGLHLDGECLAKKK